MQRSWNGISSSRSKLGRSAWLELTSHFPSCWSWSEYLREETLCQNTIYVLSRPWFLNIQISWYPDILVSWYADILISRSSHLRISCSMMVMLFVGNWKMCQGQCHQKEGWGVPKLHCNWQLLIFFAELSTQENSI